MQKQQGCAINPRSCSDIKRAAPASATGVRLCETHNAALYRTEDTEETVKRQDSSQCFLIGVSQIWSSHTAHFSSPLLSLAVICRQICVKEARIT